MIAILLTAGCASTASWEPTVFFDESIPIEQQVTLLVYNRMWVTEFSGESVNWSDASPGIPLCVAIPSGVQTIIYEWEGTGNEGGIAAKRHKNISVKLNFEPGYTYALRFDKNPSFIFRYTMDRKRERVPLIID